MHRLTYEHVKLGRSFESIRNKLQDNKNGAKDWRLDKPLTYWVRLNDRRLPAALLDRSVRELLETPFADIERTAGIGEKKIATLINLLKRVADRSAVDADDQIDDLPLRQESANLNGVFDPGQVSDLDWRAYCKKLKQFGLLQEPLGRLAPCLQDVPKVLWQTPLQHYADYSLAELRELKQYGAKRVNIILTVFHATADCLGQGSTNNHLTPCIVPRISLRLDAWIRDGLVKTNLPKCEAIRRELTLPLIEQSRHDRGDHVAQLAELRLGIAGPAKSMQQLAHHAGLTRARVYQLFDECAGMIAVRWPEGAAQMRALNWRYEHFGKSHAEAGARAALLATCTVFFPTLNSRARRKWPARPAAAT